MARRARRLCSAAFLAAALLGAPRGNAQQKVRLDEIEKALAPKPTATPPSNPFDAVLQRLDETKPALPAGGGAAARATAAPTPTPDLLGERLQDAHDSASDLLRQGNEFRDRIRRMRHECYSEQRRFEHFMRVTRRERLVYTPSQSKWMDDVEASVNSQTSRHFEELDRRLSHLDQQKTLLQQCSDSRQGRSRHEPTRGEQADLAGRCDRDIANISKYMTRLEAILTEAQRKMMNTYPAATAKIEALQRQVKQKQNQPASPFDT